MSRLSEQLWGATASTLIACTSAGVPAARSAETRIPGPRGHNPPPKVSDTSARPASTPASVDRLKNVFGPSVRGLELSFGRFGYPCDQEYDSTTRIAMLHCDRVDAPDEAGITVNFYLPGIWSSEPFTAESIATAIRDSHGPNAQVLAAFGAPDPLTSKRAYFLYLLDVYPDRHQSQVFVMKVAPLDDAVYSLFYTSLFSGSPETMAENIREWLAAHLLEYDDEIGRLTPDPSWLPHVRSRIRNEDRPR